MIEKKIKRYSGLKNNVKILDGKKFPTFQLKHQPSSGGSDKKFVKKHVLILWKSANQS